MSQKLAIQGGPKVASGSKIGWPNFDEKAIKAVEEVLRSGKVNYWTGPKGFKPMITGYETTPGSTLYDVGAGEKLAESAITQLKKMF